MTCGYLRRKVRWRKDFCNRVAVLNRFQALSFDYDGSFFRAEWIAWGHIDIAGRKARTVRDTRITTFSKFQSLLLAAVQDLYDASFFINFYDFNFALALPFGKYQTFRQPAWFGTGDDQKRHLPPQNCRDTRQPDILVRGYNWRRLRLFLLSSFQSETVPAGDFTIWHIRCVRGQCTYAAN